MIRVYERKCESVANYINLLNTHHNFVAYQELRLEQYMSGNIDPFALVETLQSYAIDEDYPTKIINMMSYLLKKYPTIFHLTVKT